MAIRKPIAKFTSFCFCVPVVFAFYFKAKYDTIRHWPFWLLWKCTVACHFSSKYWQRLRKNSLFDILQILFLDKRTISVQKSHSWAKWLNLFICYSTRLDSNSIQLKIVKLNSKLKKRSNRTKKHCNNFQNRLKITIITLKKYIYKCNCRIFYCRWLMSSKLLCFSES